MKLLNSEVINYMNDNKEEVVVEQTAGDNQEVSGTATQEETKSVDESNTEEVASNKKEEVSSFTQNQVNDIVRDRLKRAEEKIYNRYGVNDKNELDSYVGKAQSYDVMKERYNGLKDENYSLKETIAFKNNDVNPNKIDDVRTYFKGKELEFNEDNLKNELLTHPEWKNYDVKAKDNITTIKTFGNEKTEIKSEDEDAKQKRIFGI